ncbi:MAG TPA: hypothetical protein VLH94_02115 [Spirochaetia bacterium]|nr:hypothetical protein [Spirochaetia bacterium]
MAKVPVVTDEILGKNVKKFYELMHQTVEGKIDSHRVFHFLDLPLQKKSLSSSKTYILESRWVWDNSHHEYATICLEDYESKISFEDILNPPTSEEQKKFLLRQLKNIFDAQVPTHGSYKMLRVYRVLNDFSSHGVFENDNITDLHFILKPIFDFDDKGNPVPVQ